MKKLLLGSFALAALLIGASAWAADVPRKAPPAAPAAAPAAPAVSWTGCYLGGHLGAGSASKDWTNPTGDVFAGEPPDHGEADFHGFVGGGQVGCDYHFAGTWLTLGVQGMFDGAHLRGDVVDAQDSDFDLTTDVRWFGTVTGRVGFTVQPNWLLYVKGGGAWVRDRHLTFELGVPFDAAEVTRSGWTVGAGAEWMFLPNWTVFLEYDFLGFGTKTIPFAFVNGGGFSETWDIRQDVQIITVGLNVRFDWGKGKAPVVAKY
jgi:outer membrane immunogenic protein